MFSWPGVLLYCVVIKLLGSLLDISSALIYNGKKEFIGIFTFSDRVSFLLLQRTETKSLLCQDTRHANAGKSLINAAGEVWFCVQQESCSQLSALRCYGVCYICEEANSNYLLIAQSFIANLYTLFRPRYVVARSLAKLFATSFYKESLQLGAEKKSKKFHCAYVLLSERCVLRGKLFLPLAFCFEITEDFNKKHCFDSLEKQVVKYYS